MSFHCLVVDAGHTRTKFAHCSIDQGRPLPGVSQSIAVMDGQPLPWDQLTEWTRHAPAAITLVAGTNMAKARTLIDNWPKSLQAPRLLTDRSVLPLKVEVDFPEKVGIDRLLNAVAANALHKDGRPVVIVDSGTAITADIVGKDGAFRGGAILPGILLGARSLQEQTTTLPLIDVWELLKQEPPVIGKNTEAAIASGLYWGHLGAVKELVFRYFESLFQTDGEPFLLLTGGASGILAPYFPHARRETSLSLQGLALVAKRLHLEASVEMDMGDGL